MESYRSRQEVIVIEDEPYYRVSTTYFLSRLGYQVTECSDCTRVLNLVRARAQDREPFGLVIAGLNEASLALLQALRSHGAAIPVLFTTPCPDGEAIRLCNSLGQTSLLLKPYSFEEIARAMAELQRSRS